MRAPIPVGPRKPNPPLDKYEDRQNVFGPPIFREYGGDRDLFGPLDRLVYVYWVKNFGHQEGISLEGEEKEAVKRLIDRRLSAAAKKIVEENVRSMGEEKAHLEAFFVEFRKEYPLAKLNADRAFRESDFRFFHEWAAIHFGFEKTDRYHKRGKKKSDYYVGGKEWKTVY
jgi:hypothetical protein